MVLTHQLRIKDDKQNAQYIHPRVQGLNLFGDVAMHINDCVQVSTSSELGKAFVPVEGVQSDLLHMVQVNPRLNVVVVVALDHLAGEVHQVAVYSLEGEPVGGLAAPAPQHHMVDGVWAAVGSL